MSIEDPRAEAKLLNLPEAFHEEMWGYRHPEAGGKKLKHDAIRAEIKRRLGISVAPSSLSYYYKWLGVKRDMDAHAKLADQLKLELAKDPAVTEEQMQQAGQRIFLAKGIIDKDVKVFADMVLIGQNNRKLVQNEERLTLARDAGEREARKLALLEAKAAQVDRAKDVLTQKISPEEQNRRLREILK